VFKSTPDESSVAGFDWKHGLGGLLGNLMQALKRAVDKPMPAEVLESSEGEKTAAPSWTPAKKSRSETAQDEEIARNEAVHSYAEFIRTHDDVVIVEIGGVPRVDLSSAEEWQISAGAFADDPIVLKAIEDRLNDEAQWQSKIGQVPVF